jgi:uncharacterized protein (TIGR00266 family)
MELTQDDNGKVWYLDLAGSPQGPYSEAQIRNGIKQGKVKLDMLLFGPGMGKWEPVGWHPLFSHNGAGGEQGAIKKQRIPKATFHQQELVHDIDFAIYGDDMQYVEIELDPHEAALAEAGAMMYMDDTIAMETVFGEGKQSGVVDSLLGAGKRLLTGESLFMTVFTNSGAGKKRVAFAAPYPGKIIPINLAEFGGEIICQKDGFLCAAKGVTIDIVFQRRLGVGLFGGEGFIMQSLKGDGLAFVHAGGSIHNVELKPGETLKVDTGCLVALENTIDYDVEYVGGVKSAIFGGEGIFFARLTGPGNVWLQSLPFSRFASKLNSAIPRKSGGKGSVGEGSLLDSLGGIGNILTGR